MSDGTACSRGSPSPAVRLSPRKTIRAGDATRSCCCASAMARPLARDAASGRGAPAGPHATTISGSAASESVGSFACASIQCIRDSRDDRNNRRRARTAYAPERRSRTTVDAQVDVWMGIGGQKQIATRLGCRRIRDSYQHCLDCGASMNRSEQRHHRSSCSAWAFSLAPKCARVPRDTGSPIQVSIPVIPMRSPCMARPATSRAWGEQVGSTIETTHGRVAERRFARRE